MSHLPWLAALAAAAAAAAASAQTPASGGHSAFDGYQPFADQPVSPWKEANDQVGRIGGWRAYAREARPGQAQPPAAAASAPASAPAAPRAADPHAGHH